MHVKDRYYQSNVYLKEDVYDNNRFNGISPFIVYEYNTSDYKYFSTEGLHLKVKLNYFEGSEINVPGSTSIVTESSIENHNWFAMSCFLHKAFPLGKWYSLGIVAHATYSNLPLLKVIMLQNCVLSFCSDT